MGNNWLIGTACHPGLKRAENQDGIGVFRPTWFNRRPPLLVLADGMGGYQGGSQASQIVIRSFLNIYRKLRGTAGTAFFQQGIHAAHQKIQQLAKREEQFKSMGSTLVAAILEQEQFLIVNVGDSRAYHLHQEELTQVSTDQSLVAELVRQGLLTPQEMLGHPKRNKLSMSISAPRSEVTPVFATVASHPGDMLLLCSDGLWSVVPETEILYYMQNFPPQVAVDDLVRLACDYGGPDNISLIIARRAPNKLSQEGS